MRQMAGRLASATGSPLKGNFTRQGTATTGHDRFHAHKVSSPWETLIGRGQIDRSIKANRKLNRSNSTLEFLAFTFFRREIYIYIYIERIRSKYAIEISQTQLSRRRKERHSSRIPWWPSNQRTQEESVSIDNNRPTIGTTT